VAAVADVLVEEFGIGRREAHEPARALVARYAHRHHTGLGFADEEPAALAVMERAADAMGRPRRLPHVPEGG
jgi:hypothetical protein